MRRAPVRYSSLPPMPRQGHIPGPVLAVILIGLALAIAGVENQHPKPKPAAHPAPAPVVHTITKTVTRTVVHTVTRAPALSGADIVLIVIVVAVVIVGVVALLPRVLRYARG
jgi:hypothetical protein